MEFELSTNPLPRNILRADDSIRLPRPFRLDTHERPRAASEDARIKADQYHATMAGALEDDSPPREKGTTGPQIKRSEPSLLTPDETTELFRSKMEDARQDREHALAGNEDF